MLHSAISTIQEFLCLIFSQLSSSNSSTTSRFRRRFAGQSDHALRDVPQGASPRRDHAQHQARRVVQSRNLHGHHAMEGARSTEGGASGTGSAQYLRLSDEACTHRARNCEVSLRRRLLHRRKPQGRTARQFLLPKADAPAQPADSQAFDLERRRSQTQSGAVRSEGLSSFRQSRLQGRDGLYLRPSINGQLRRAKA